MTPSQSAQICSMLSTPERFSILAMTSMEAPPFACRNALRSATSCRLETNEAATKSTSFSMPKSRSDLSCSDRYGPERDLLGKLMIGDGCCSFVSIALGKKDGQSAGTAVGNAIVLSAAAGLALAALYAVFQAPILRLFGATEANYGYAKEYFTWITVGMKTVCESFAPADLVRQLPVLAGGLAAYAGLTLLACRVSEARFEKVDL